MKSLVERMLGIHSDCACDSEVNTVADVDDIGYANLASLHEGVIEEVMSASISIRMI